MYIKLKFGLENSRGRGTSKAVVGKITAFNRCCLPPGQHLWLWETIWQKSLWKCFCELWDVEIILDWSGGQSGSPHHLKGRWRMGCRLRERGWSQVEVIQCEKGSTHPHWLRMEKRNTSQECVLSSSKKRQRKQIPSERTQHCWHADPRALVLNLPNATALEYCSSCWDAQPWNYFCRYFVAVIL